MADNKDPKTLSDQDIVSSKPVTRRSLLSKTGIGFAVGAAVLAVRGKAAHAGDKKTGDMRDRKNPDPTSVDTDR
jgi:hypothetical protein